MLPRSAIRRLVALISGCKGRTRLFRRDAPCSVATVAAHLGSDEARRVHAANTELAGGHAATRSARRQGAAWHAGVGAPGRARAWRVEPRGWTLILSVSRGGFASVVAGRQEKPCECSRDQSAGDGKSSELQFSEYPRFSPAVPWARASKCCNATRFNADAASFPASASVRPARGAGWRSPRWARWARARAAQEEAAAEAAPRPSCPAAG